MRISYWSSDVCASDLRPHKCLGNLRERSANPDCRQSDWRHHHLGRWPLVAPSRTEETIVFKKILVANRGEIACWVMSTAKAMGIEMGRESGREGVCQYVKIAGVAVSLKKKTQSQTNKKD